MQPRSFRALTAVVLGGLLLAGPSMYGALATASFSSTRLSGLNRYGTAKAIGVSFGSATTVLIASGAGFADALAGSYLAGNKSAPVLLTFPDSLPSETKEALDTIKPQNAVIVGGTAVVSERVRTELTARGITVTRVSGDNRYATARAVAENPGPSYVGSVDNKKAALLASGENFPDALAAGPASYAGRLPLLLTTKSTLSPDALAAMKTLGVTQAFILGGAAAVDPVVDAALLSQGITSTRIAGDNRSQTANKVATDLEYAKLAFPKTHLNLARGDDFADALTGGPHGGKEKAPIVLSQSSSTLGSDTTSFVTANAATLADGHVLGGTAAVSDAVKTEFDTAAKGSGTTTTAPTTTTTTTVTTTTPSGYTITPTTPATKTNGETVTYTASGLGSSPVNIALFTCANATSTSSGTATFPTGSSTATQGATSATIASSVTGTMSSDGSRFTNVQPNITGTVTFGVVGPSAGRLGTCVVPVVFSRADGNDTLSINAGGTPTETYVAGPRTTFVPANGPNGPINQSNANGVNVMSFDLSATVKSFVGCDITSATAGQTRENLNESRCFTYNFDGTDVYLLGGPPSNQAAFELNLTVNDDVQGDYVPNPLPSTFNLVNEVTATATSSTQR